MASDGKPRILHTGEARVLIGFTVSELVEIAQATVRKDVYERVLTAIGLINPDLERELRS